MKKYFALALVLLTAASASSCTPSSDSTLPSVATPQIVTSAATAPTESQNPNAPSIKEEIVEKATRANVTEPSETASKSTDATEPTEKKKKKNTSSQLPTQGEVNPYLDIQVTTAPSGSLEETDFDFVIDGAFVEIGDEIDDAVALIGDDNSVTELSDTEFQYEYEGLCLTTHVKGNKEIVDSITVTSSDYPTQKGAVVGMYATQLRKFYGEATKKSDALYTYKIGKKKLDFTVEDNIVTAIVYSR